MDILIEKAAANELKAKPNGNKLGFGAIFTDHMFVMEYDETQGWHNAKVTKYQNFSLDPAAMTLHYGQAIFEGLKAYRGENDDIFLFRPKDNLARLNTSATRMCMPNINIEDVFQGLQELLRIDQDWIPPRGEGASLYIRPTMIATEGALGVRAADKYLFFIILSPVGAYYAEGFNPVNIFVTDKYVRAVPGGVGNAKTAGNYAASIMAAVEAEEAGFTQVLWLDAVHRKYIEEVGTMNIFFVIGDEVVTPPLSGSILPGITRDSVLQIARDLGYTVNERLITIDEVFKASEEGLLKEVFGTGTAAIISPVGSLNYKGDTCSVNNGQIGTLAQRLFDDLQDIQYGQKKESYSWVTKL